MATDNRQTDVYSTRSAIAVTPSNNLIVDENSVARATRKVYVGSGGNLVVQHVDDANPVTYTAVIAGTTLDIRVVKILPATSAGAIVARF